MKPNAKTYLDLWIKLDNLWDAGKGEGPEADALRDTMETPWYAMSEEEIGEVEEEIKNIEDNKTLKPARELVVSEYRMTKEAISEAYKALSAEEKDFYRKTKKALHFAPENEQAGSTKEHLSPSGKYKLVTSKFTTTPTSWSYTQGKVFQVGSDTPIAIVQRNYSAFPFSFVEGHANGHDYIVAGQDYQGQTVVELDTGKRRDTLSDGTDKGHGFCWAESRYDAASQVLTVCGCHWACPYEFRFYDFSNPMEGWPEIEGDTCVDEDPKWPEIDSDGTIRSFASEGKYNDEDEDGPKKDPIFASISTFKREGLTLVLQNEWVSDKEKQNRIDREEGNRKYEAEITKFKATDPLYLAYLERVKDPDLSPDTWESVGITHENWCPDFKERERRLCRRIVYRKKGPGPTIDLEWAAVSGPIKLVIYKDGKHFEDKFFEHSVAAMNEAFTYAKSVVHGS